MTAVVDITELDFVIVPVNIRKSHWILAGADMTAGLSFHMHSLRGGSDAGVITVQTTWVVHEVADKKSSDEALTLDVED